MLKNIKKGKYRHYKGGLYEVLGEGLDSESLEKFVIYKALYESKDFKKGTIWLRPFKMFFEEVEIEGKRVKRFEKI